jgi:hypothetical protein
VIDRPAPETIKFGNRLASAPAGETAMADQIHKFKVGQTVDLIHSTFRSAASGSYQIVSLRPAEDGSTRYRIKSKSESHERVVSESDLVLPPKF